MARTNRGVSICFGVALLLGFASKSSSPHQEALTEARGHANRGVALLEQFRFTEAAAEFEAVVELEPDSVPGLVNLGIAYFNERDFDRALEVFERAKGLDPDDPHVHYNLGLIFKLIGNTEEAVLAFEEVLARDAEDSMTLYYLGSLYASLGRLDEAESTLRRAIELQPNNESAHFSLGNVLIRQGRSEEGREELQIFQSLKESFPAAAASAGLQYTELGKYAEAIEPSSPPLQQSQPEATVESAVRWIDATAEVGLALAALPSPPTWPRSLPAAAYGREFVRSRLLPHWGSGLAFRDLDSDGDPDLVFVRGGGVMVFLNDEGRFRSATTGLPEPADDGKFVGLTVGDIDGDGDPDVYLVGSGPNALFINGGNGRFSSAGSEAGVGGGSDVSVGATFADVDHDGDLDIYVSNYVDPEATHDGDTLRVPHDLAGAPNRLYRNNRDGTFTEIGEASLTAGASRSLGAVFSDLDDDRDIDFLVVNDGEPLQVFSNDRVGTFTESSLDWGIEASGRFRGADTADFDRDGSLDVFMTAETEFDLTPKQAGNLREFLDRGGFIHADDCCHKYAKSKVHNSDLGDVWEYRNRQTTNKMGKRGLDGDRFFMDYIRILNQLYPDNPVQRIPHDHEIFRIYFKLNGCPAMQGVDHGAWGLFEKGTGRLMSVITPCDIHCGWMSKYFSERKNMDAIKMGINILLYYMTH